ncbi:MAG TPA: NAD(+) synthase [Eggerthellaceae bacterium]|nr:NAD(+) synthase [Eggerthellaceae bacterium]
MGNLSKLRIGVGQMRIVQGRASENDAATDRMIDRAVEAGADLLVLPGSLRDRQAARLIGLNDTRIDIEGDAVVVEACGETYRIGMHDSTGPCDFHVLGDAEPYAIVQPAPSRPASTIRVRPVGMLEEGKNVFAFDGGSAVYGSDGQELARLKDDFTEDFALVTLGERGTSAPECEHKPLTAIVSTMRRFDEQVLPWQPKWIIGLSGGLDSSVVAALLALAFGPERIVAYNMATRFNSSATKGNAAALARALDIPLRNGSIEEQVVALGNTLVQYGYPTDALGGVVLENVQARTRGALLSAFAALEGGVVVNNGNRVEAAIGYATLYGDAIGALCPIGDLTKVQLFDLARTVNREIGYEVIPENLLPIVTDTGLEWQTMPSAELANGQLDPMKWFYHDWLVGQLLGDGGPGGAATGAGAEPRGIDEAACEIMQRYLDDRLGGTPAGRWVRYYGLDDPRVFLDDLEWIVRSMRASAFKRIQAPPTIRIASSASVHAHPESQTPVEPSARYLQLRTRIRAL